jgi:hypothetical protein
MYVRADPGNLESVPRPPIPTPESARRKALGAGSPDHLLGCKLRDRLALEITIEQLSREGLWNFKMAG